MMDSWEANAGLWTEAVRSRAIASRRLATDAAILGAVLRRRPRRLLDLGCGEGWLCRAVATQVPERVGVDASQALVDAARSAGSAAFHHASYEDIAAGRLGRLGRFDVVVANFALLDEDLQPLLQALLELTEAGGGLVIQTLHPAAAPPPYEDGWREETFASFGDGRGWTPMPWYFRTTGGWLSAIAQAWRVQLVEEPINPATGGPASLLITAEKR